MLKAVWVLVQLESGDADGGAGREMDVAEGPAAWGNEAGEAGGVGEGEAEAFFYDAA